MFLGGLDNEQGKSFLAMATKMAMADGRVNAEENRVLRDIQNSLETKEVLIPDEVFGPTNTAPFDTHAARVTTLLGLMVVAYADDTSHVDESAVFAEAVKAFEFDDEQVARMQAWAKKKVNLLNEFYEMMGE